MNVPRRAVGAPSGAGVLAAFVLAAAGFRAVPAHAALEVSLSADPAVAAVGSVLTLTFTVTNTGGLDESGVSATLQVDAGESLLSALEGPVPAAPVTVTAGGTTAFVWTFTVTGAGPLSFTATETAGFAVAASASAVAAQPAALSVTVWTLPSVMTVGNSFGVLVTVANTGGFPATGVAPVFEVNEGAAGPFTAPVPATADIAPGSSTAFFCGLPANGAGLVRFTVTAAGFDTGLMTTIAAAGSGTATVLTPASISVSLLAGPSPIVAGAVLTVTLWVQNTGEEGASLTPDLGVSFGAGRVAPRSAPDSAPTEVAGLNLVPFVWTFSVAGCGSAGFTASVTGNAMVVFAPVGAWAASAPVALKGDPYDPMDDAATAGSWLMSGPDWSGHGPHALCAGDAADWYRVTLERGAAYRFETAGSGDAFAELFDDAGGATVVASDDDGAGALQPRLDAMPVRSGTFWLRVRTVPAGTDWAGQVRHRRLLASALAVSPATAAVGQVVTVVLAVTNTGSADFGSATGAFTPGPGLAVLTAPAPTTVPAGGSASFTWTASVTGAGAISLTATVEGIEAGTGRPLATFASAALSALQPAALAAAVSADPDPAATGGWIAIRLTVTNAGTETATGVTPTVGFTAGGALVAPISAPAGGVTLGPGSAATFTWTWSASGAGAVGFSATAAGTGAVSGLPLEAGAHGILSVQDRAVLAASLLVSPANAETGTSVRVVLSVTNTGGFPATGVVPAIEAVAGGGLAVDLAGPEPAGPVTLGPQGRACFTWTYSITGAGTIVFSATAAGTDAGTGGPVAASSVSALPTAAPPAVSAGLALSSSSPVVGQVLIVTLDAANAGGVDVAGVMPVIQVNRGSALLVPLTGPLPAGPVTLTAGGGMQLFTWTFSVTGAGVVEFTATAAGSDSWTGAAVQSAATSGATPRGASGLTAALVLSSSSAWGYLSGGTVTAVLTVSNSGDVDAAGVTPAAAAYTGGAILGLTGGPNPAGPVTVAAHGQTAFTWTWSLSGTGVIGISATATGADAVTAAPLAAASAATAQVLARGALSAQLLAPVSAREGESFEVTLTLANSGSEYVQAGLPVLIPSDPARVGVSAPRVLGPGWVPGYLAPGAVTRVRWTVKALSAGPVTLDLTASGSRISDGSGTSVSSSAALVILEAFDAGHPVVAWPNPVAGDTLSVAVRIPRVAARLVVEVYSASFRKIADGEWRMVTPGAGAQVRLTGVRGWATGVYLVRVKAWYEDGEQQTFAPVNVAVKR